MNKQNIFSVFLFLLIFPILFLFANNALADFACECADGTKDVSVSCDACTTLCASNHKGVKSCSQAGSTTNNSNTSDSVKLDNPLGTSITTPQELIGKIINSVLGVVGSIALLMFVFGGLTWMTSSGSAEKVKKGRDIIMWSAIGLVIIFSAYGLVRVILQGIK